MRAAFRLFAVAASEWRIGKTRSISRLLKIELLFLIFPSLLYSKFAVKRVRMREAREQTSIVLHMFP